MRSFSSFEDLAVAGAAQELCPVLESFSPTSIVGWYNTIKFKLRDMIAKQEASRNFEYSALLRTYLNTWEKYPIDANMNREVLELLTRSAEPYSTMDWNQQSFFNGLVRSLNQLIADQEALPGGVDTEQNMSMSGGSGGGMPPLSPGFGAEEKPPQGLGGEPGQDEPPGMPGGPEAGNMPAVPEQPKAPGAKAPGDEDEENKAQPPPI